MALKRDYGGRPTLPDKDRKDVFIKVRVSPQEKNLIMKLHSKTGYKNFSNLVRDVLLREKIKVEVSNIEMLNINMKLDEIKEKYSTLQRIKKKESNPYISMQIAEMIDELKKIDSKLHKVYLCLDDIVTIDKNKNFDIEQD